MLDIRFIRENPDATRKGIAAKGFDPAQVDLLLERDTRLRAMKSETEALRSQQNATSKEYGRTKKLGGDLAALQREADAVKARVAELDAALVVAEREVQELMDVLPSLPHADVPLGRDASENKKIREWGTLPTIPHAKPHWEIGARYGLEIERGGRVSGSGFPFLVGPLAKLERILIQYFIDTHTTTNGYTEVACPFLVREHSLYGTGHLPKFRGEQYYTERDDLYMVPTAEGPLTNLHREEILQESELPRRFVAYTPCWRREAGAAGVDTRGLKRLHQFSKVELMEVVHPAKSLEAHETLTRNAERLLEELGVPYRRMLMCSGDMGFANVKQYDLEIWAAGAGEWLEVSSCSFYDAFQARRCKLRYKDSSTGRNEFCHTINGSALALPRLLVVLMENGQQPDGRVKLPAALHDRYGGAYL